MEKKLNARIKLKRDTEANWNSNNPTLLYGEYVIVETADGKLRSKTGDGESTYSQLPFDDAPLFDMMNNVNTGFAASEDDAGEGGVTLPTLTNPAGAGDIVAGKEAIDGEGNKITGTMEESGNAKNTISVTVSILSYNASLIYFDANKNQCIVSPGTTEVVNAYGGFIFVPNTVIGQMPVITGNYTTTSLFIVSNIPSVVIFHEDGGSIQVSLEESG